MLFKQLMFIYFKWLTIIESIWLKVLTIYSNSCTISGTKNHLKKETL